MRSGLHPQRQYDTARAAYVDLRGDMEARWRALEIGALPLAAWRGRSLRVLRCAGGFGRGPHLVNVPEALLWALMDLRVWRCPYHAGGLEAE